jgi:hypothetical protein
MEDDILLSVARVGVHVGMHLIGQDSRPTRELDGTALANAIIKSSVDQACEIVSKLGIVRQIDVERGDFGLIVGIIAREHFSLTEALTDLKLSLADSSLDVGDICMRAYLALIR